MPATADAVLLIQDSIPSDLYVRLVGGDVVNFRAMTRQTTDDDVVAVRAALLRVGFTEVGSWVATEGMSWLSDGVESVSIKIAPAG